MARIQTCGFSGRPADYHDRRDLEPEILMKLCLHSDMQTGRGKSRLGPSTGRRVMVVQRRAIELQVMAEMLGALGCRVTRVAESGKALLYIGRESFDMVISELDIPKFNGFQLARCIRKCAPQIPILLMTARCQAEVVDYMDSQVVDGWLFKPFRLSVLSDVLKEVGWTSQSAAQAE
jgi:CheY-like chemotaxis protein